MNETKHTPGKWKVMQNPGDSADKRIYVGTVKKPIADICDLYGDESQANARLIAYSPELFQALEALVDDEECRFDHHGYCQTHNLSNPCDMQRAREVIAKVKGESCND